MLDAGKKTWSFSCRFISFWRGKSFDKRVFFACLDENKQGFIKVVVEGGQNIYRACRFCCWNDRSNSGGRFGIQGPTASL